MHYYDGWEQHQPSLLDNHWYYPQYVDEVYTYRQRIERPEDETEHIVDETRDTITSATSSEIFRLEFAANQWSKLVSNAEGLFNKLISTNVLPHTEQDQIEQWLCMKQEYEECISNDCIQGFDNLAPDSRRSLERIEEETDENFHRTEFENCSESYSGIESELSEEDEEEEQTDTESESPDFLEKLDDYMNKFKEETDRLVESKKDVFGEVKAEPVPIVPRLMNNNSDFTSIVKPIPIRNTNSRRNSILPGSEMCQELKAFNESLKNQQNQNYQFDIFDKFKVQGSNSMGNRDIELQNISEEDSTVINAAYLAFQKDNSPDILVDALKNTEFFEPIKALKSVSLKSETKQSQVKQIQTDPTDIRFSTKDSCKTSESKLSIKQRFQQKKNKSDETGKESKDKSKKKFDNNKNEDTDSVTSEKKSTDSKKMKQLKKEEQRKKDKEIKKAKQADKNATITKASKETFEDSEDDRNSMKSKSSKKGKDALKMNTIMTQLDNALKEKSTTMKRTVEEIEDLRNEIRNVRKTRDDLLDKKCALKEKCKLEGNLSSEERRMLLECGEVVEVIDAVIEHKNEMICGRKDFDEHRAQRERGVHMLMKRLSKLTDGELKTLFYLYFKKVIDLKESTRILERQLEEVEMFYNAKFQDYQIATQKKVKQFLQYQYLQLTSKNGTISEHDKIKFNKYKKEIRDLRQQLANVTALLKGKVVQRPSSPSRIPRQELKQIGNNNGATTTITMEGHKMIFRKTMTDKIKK